MAELAYPIKLNDNYTCQGTDANGASVFWDDLLYEGDVTGPSGPGGGEGYSDARVVRRDDGLWVEADPTVQEEIVARVLGLATPEGADAS